MDEIEEIVEEMKKNNIVDVDCLLQEKEYIKQRETMINSKLFRIENALSNKKVVIPKKFKKIKEVISTKDINKFYYNLIFRKICRMG